VNVLYHLLNSQAKKEIAELIAKNKGMEGEIEMYKKSFFIEKRRAQLLDLDLKNVKL
jgi:hypothetical protein